MPRSRALPRRSRRCPPPPAPTCGGRACAHTAGARPGHPNAVGPQGGDRRVRKPPTSPARRARGPPRTVLRRTDRASGARQAGSSPAPGLPDTGTHAKPPPRLRHHDPAHPPPDRTRPGTLRAPPGGRRRGRPARQQEAASAGSSARGRHTPSPGRRFAARQVPATAKAGRPKARQAARATSPLPARRDSSLPAPFPTCIRGPRDGRLPSPGPARRTTPRVRPRPHTPACGRESAGSSRTPSWQAPWNAIPGLSPSRTRPTVPARRKMQKRTAPSPVGCSLHPPPSWDPACRRFGRS